MWSPACSVVCDTALDCSAGVPTLGYDTARSMDHGWGPRLVVLVDAVDVDRARSQVESGLPAEFGGVRCGSATGSDPPSTTSR